ncbi:MAG: site-2 protease family protein [Pseudomonadota bacterium]
MAPASSALFVFRGPWGVPVEVKTSILLLPLFLINLGGTPQDLVYDGMFVLILLGSVFLHELGHAWGCLIQGVPVKRIVLHCGGGFCERTRSATRYEQELIVGMGPIVTLTLWAGAGLIAPFINDPEIARVFWMISSLNGFLAVLNLLPVNPLDGGKLFALLMHRLFRARLAIIISASVGLLFAVIWVPVMFLGFVQFGFILFFLPSVALHWRMLVRAARA